MSKRFWTTREGQQIAPADMDDRHLVNTIAMLERKARKARCDALLEAHRFAATCHGEAATDAIESAIFDMENGELCVMIGEAYPVYLDMLEEAVSRGLIEYEEFPYEEGF